MKLCDNCWGKQVVHRKPPTGQLPHEKKDVGNAEIEMKIKNCILPTLDDVARRRMHEADHQTTWFGTVKIPLECGFGYERRFHDYKRFEQLMFKYPPQARSRLCPSLVSFLGQTGAGKSSLIRLLITLLHTEKDPIEVPISGSIEDAHTATSGDVHLYHDPASSTSRTPILYADCEGLQGGETEPISSKILGNTIKRACLKLKHSIRELSWANTENCDMSHFTRQFVKLRTNYYNVYRAAEQMVLQLLDWGTNSVEHSSNQPTLPHAIVAVNMSPNSLGPEFWETGHATQWLFSGVDSALSLNPEFEKYINAWGGPPNMATTKALLEHYYSSVKVVRIPLIIDGTGRLSLMNEQINRLYNEIREDCDLARQRKAHLQMLLTADQLSTYTQLAFDHFTSKKGLNYPFDFIDASLRAKPICCDFSTHIVTLASALISKFEKENLPNTFCLFANVGKFVASCIVLDAARNKRQGSYETIFSGYKEFCIKAVEESLDRYWPCEYSGCVNFKIGHAADHQNKHGKFIGPVNIPPIRATNVISLRMK
ncbi:hypothetical protein BDY21DRAFT_292842 [Lineolata rhizophorae]|uniref:Uncharacterized protein n=1 Tax=Lineolata rhizophorae TaxID=578093 RepID=A0A6A6NPG2_9PEZI|nr:hypothetical protein BDY21DRAFT_292842 [Lineolata rhizophorae]